MEAAEAGAGGAFMIRTASSVSIICAHLCVCVCVHLYMRMRGGRGGRGASRPIVRRYDREGHLGAVKLRVGVVCVGNGVCVRVCTNSLRQARRRRPAYHRDCGAACARDAPSWPVESSERWPKNTHRLNALVRMCSCMCNHWPAANIARSTVAGLKLNQMEQMNATRKSGASN